MKKDYTKPTILRVGNPLYVKHGSSTQNYQFVRDSIEGIKIADLVAEFGSPLFVFSEAVLRQKYRAAKKAIDAVYPNVQFGWSYKTNYLNSICKVFHEEGACAEVVSAFEYEKARALGIPGHEIIYNGPYKPIESLERAVIDGAQIHVDNMDEIADINEIAKRLDKKVKTGVRLNLNAGIYPIWSRFGFNLECGQAMSAIKRIHQSSNLQIGGIHTHLGTFVLDTKAYGRAVEKISDFIKDVEKFVGYNIEFLDLGGGFASKNHLKAVYQPPEIIVPSPEAYAKEIEQPLKWLAQRNPAPKLIMELGRHLVDEAGFLITTVVAEKLLSDGRRSYVLDAGVNLLYTATWYKFKIELEKENKGIAEPSILFGPLCMNIDVVDESIMLPRLSRFQRLILSPVGAYNVTQWMQFIQYRPAIVMIDETGKTRVIRRAETLEDLNRMES